MVAADDTLAAKGLGRDGYDGQNLTWKAALGSSLTAKTYKKEKGGRRKDGVPCSRLLMVHIDIGLTLT